MRRSSTLICLLSIVGLASLMCGKKAEGPAPKGKSNEELIKERFAIYKDAYQQKDIDKIMSIISASYWDQYNHSKADYRNWLQTVLTGWEWKSPVEMSIVGNITIEPGWVFYIQERNTKANHNTYSQIWGVNTSHDLLMTTKSDLSFSWELMEGLWYITRIWGTVGRVTTQPSSIPPSSEVTVSVFTLPEGAPLTHYDTESVSIHDWNGNPISVQDQGNRLYSGTFTAPTAAGEYALTATVSDTTWNKTLSFQHKFIVR